MNLKLHFAVLKAPLRCTRSNSPRTMPEAGSIHIRHIYMPSAHDWLEGLVCFIFLGEHSMSTTILRSLFSALPCLSASSFVLTGRTVKPAKNSAQDPSIYMDGYAPLTQFHQIAVKAYH